MLPATAPSRDAGFPRPALTLVFDDYARRHLVADGQFPAETVEVTGSPRLDVLSSRFGALTEAELAAARSMAGAAPDRDLVLLVTKYSEARAVLPLLLRAFRDLDRAYLAIKTHPAV